MNKKWIRGDVSLGEWAIDHEARKDLEDDGVNPTAAWEESHRRQSASSAVPYLGRSRLAPERATVVNRSEKSAEAVVLRKQEGPNRGRPRSPSFGEDSASEVSKISRELVARGRDEIPRAGGSDEVGGCQHS